MCLISELLWNLGSLVGLEGLNPSLRRPFPVQMICWLKRLIRMALEQIGLNMESVSVSNFLHVFRKSGIESTSCILVCACLAEHLKYTQYWDDSALLKSHQVYDLDSEILSNKCIKSTMQFLPVLINCLLCKHCFSCWTSVCVLKLKENFILFLTVIKK